MVGSVHSSLPRSHDIHLHTSFWVIPLKLSIVALVLAIGGVVADTLLADTYTRLPTPLRLAPDDARTVLATITGASITVVALVVSLVMIVLALVATTVGPRIERNLIKRRAIQLAIGAFVGTFVYSLVVLTSVSSGHDSEFVPLISTWLDVVAAIASTAVLVWCVHDLAFSIQIGNLLVSIATDLTDAIESQFAIVAGTPTSSVPPTLDKVRARAVSATRSGYVQEVRHGPLLHAAAEANAVVHLMVRPGDFVLADGPIAYVDATSGASCDAAVRRDIVVGSHRTLHQDLDFAIAQLVEIALRALSPAVNDPYTARMCIDWLTDAVHRLERGPGWETGFVDELGVVRVVTRSRTTASVIETAFDQIRQASAVQPAVVVHLLAGIERLGSALTAPDGLAALELQANATLASALACDPVEKDREAINAAHRRAVHAVHQTIATAGSPR